MIVEVAHQRHVEGGLYVTLDALVVAAGDCLVVGSAAPLERRQIEMAVVSKLSG